MDRHAAEHAPPRWSGGLWRDPDFVRLWLAETVSKTGDAVSTIAIPLVAISVLQATPAQIGLIGAVQVLPVVLLGLPAGVWVDRWARRRYVMVVADLLRGVCLLTVIGFTAMLLLNSLGIAVHNVNQVSVRQAVTPNAMRARVAAAQRLLIFGALPVGTMVGGFLGAAMGLRPTIWIGTVGLFAGTIPYWVSGIRRLRRVPEVDVVR